MMKHYYIDHLSIQNHHHTCCPYHHHLPVPLYQNLDYTEIRLLCSYSKHLRKLKQKQNFTFTQKFGIASALCNVIYLKLANFV